MAKVENTLVNSMSVDVEDYFQVSAFENQISRDAWNSLECRIEKNISNVLEIFDNHNVKATFFILGWIAKRYPGLVKKIAIHGHEIASHGSNHLLVSSQTSSEFKTDIQEAKLLLEDLVGKIVKGYRAPSFSINSNNIWALDIIKECGYLYSSSIYPVRHDLYGMPKSPRFLFIHEHSGIIEIPMSTVKIHNLNIPCSGGGYFRLYPYWFSKWAIKRINMLEGKSAIFYFHPWELDPSQPRVKGTTFKTRFRHYINLRKTRSRIQQLLSDFQWDRIDKVFDI